MKVAILHGYVPAQASKDEQDVLVQVDLVAQALTVLGYEPVAVPLTLDLATAAAQLRALQPSLVFNLVETIEAKGQYIHLGPSLLDGLRLPYTGAPTTATFATSNKLLAKTMLTAAGLPTPAWFVPEDVQWDALPFRPPYIVKSVWEHGSIGLDETAIITDPAQLQPLLTRRASHAAAPWFVEQYIPGREFNVSLLAGRAQPEVFPPAELVFVGYPAGKAHIVDYRAKWEEDSFEYQHIDRRHDFTPEEAPVLSRMAELARACWQVFGLRGYARVDMRLDDAQQLWILEINTNPCLSPDSGFVVAAMRAGWEFPALIRRIIADCARTVVAPALLAEMHQATECWGDAMVTP